MCWVWFEASRGYGDNLSTIPHVSVGDQGRDFTPHFQPLLLNGLPQKNRENTCPMASEQWGQTISVSGIALLWNHAQTCSGFPSPGKHIIFSIVHSHFLPLLVYLHRPVFNGMIPHCLPLDKSFASTAKGWIERNKSVDFWIWYMKKKFSKLSVFAVMLGEQSKMLRP